MSRDTTRSARTLFLCLLLCCLALPAAGAEQGTVGGYPKAQALRLGAAMYRDGILPSGQSMKATVQEDIELDGAMSPCANCHQRSGMGALEGGILSPPTNGARLYAPLKSPLDIPGSIMKRSNFKGGRPAYNRESLATLLRTGIGPAGKRISETMPLYHLSEDEMAIMIFYLEQLSSELSPGVSDDEIRFATILAEGTSPGDRDSLLLPLNTFITEVWNAQIPARDRSLQGAKLPDAAKPPAAAAYRRAALDVWELKGAPESWGRQLESLYRERPVFALLGGIAPGKWDPVHRFCEKMEIPCIFPLTDLPVLSEKDWYTLYFSKGYYQEGEAAAKYLSRVFALPPGKKLIQLYRDGDQAKALARGFGETWRKLGDTALSDRPVAGDEKIDAKFWEQLVSSHPDAVLLLWLAPADLAGIEALAASEHRPSTIFLSATLLAGALQGVPEGIRDLTLITYPTRLPGDLESGKSASAGWASFNTLPISNRSVAAKSYLITRVLARVLVDMGASAYRDFFLDIVDEGKDDINSTMLFPTLSFGPGQRYASKGGYVVSVSKGKDPQVVRQSDWIIY